MAAHNPPVRRRLLLVAAALLTVVPAAWAQGDIRYDHTDAIGSVRLVTDASGAVVERDDYTPFGQDLPGNPSPPDPRGFAGKERDQATGLDYFGGRYYQSPAGRFTTVDPVLDVPATSTLTLKVAHAAYKGYDLATTVSGIVESAQTLASLDATGTEKALAAVSLVGELSGVTDALKAGRGVLNVAAAKTAGQLGREGEALASQITGAAKNTESWIINGRARIPDQVLAQDILTRNPSHITEVKNWA